VSNQVFHRPINRQQAFFADAQRRRWIIYLTTRNLDINKRVCLFVLLSD